MAEKGQKTCPRCEEPFTCGMAAGDQKCWCAELPNIIPIDGIVYLGDNVKYEDCLCPSCLRELIERLQNQPD